ncbi:MAG: hypothetical protein ACRDA3_09160 [Peptostreptococcaceae bacterium]
MSKKSLIITLAISLLAVPLYIYSFNNDLRLFWIIFAIDRIASPMLQAKFEKALDTFMLEPEDDSEVVVMGKFLISVVVLILLGIVMLIYVLFKSPTLFAILILGELMDNIAEKTFKKSVH